MTNSKSKFWKKGFGLIVVLGFAAVLAVFTAAIGAQAAYNLNAVQRQSETDMAYYGAYSGIQLCLALLRQPPPFNYISDDGTQEGTWLEINRKVKLALGARSVGGTIIPGPVEAGARVYHNIEGFPGAVGAPGTPVSELPPDGTQVPLNHFYIMAVGEVNHGEDTPGVRFEATTMGATIAPIFPTMPHAIFGHERVRVQGNLYHFDSRDGNFVPLAGPHANPEASVATNQEEAIDGSGDPVVEILADSEIDGNVYFGTSSADSVLQEFINQMQTEHPAASFLPPGVSVNLPLFGRTNLASAGANDYPLSGRVVRLPVERTLPDAGIPLEAERTDLASGTLNSTLTLIPGTTYYVPGDLTIGPSGNILVGAPFDPDADGPHPGDATIFINGNLTIEPGGPNINALRLPRTLKFFLLPADANFEMDGGQGTGWSPGDPTGREGNFMVAGNDLNVEVVGRALIRGAIFAREAQVLHGSEIHYDVALRDPGLLADTYGYEVVGFAASTGAVVAPGVLAPPPVNDPEQLPGGPPPPPPGGGGCGCGGGSTEFMMKE